MMRLLPKNTHPMDRLRTGVSMLAPLDPEVNDNSHAANIRKAPSHSLTLVYVLKRRASR